MSTCPRCGATFSCCMADAKDKSHCWCMQMPPLAMQDLAKLVAEREQNRCLCPACLQSITENGASDAPP